MSAARRWWCRSLRSTPIRAAGTGSCTDAAPPELAAPLVDAFAAAAPRRRGLVVASGVFGAHMLVALENDGPVTIVLDSAAFNEARSSH